MNGRGRPPLTISPEYERLQLFRQWGFCTRGRGLVGRARAVVVLACRQASNGPCRCFFRVNPKKNTVSGRKKGLRHTLKFLKKTGKNEKIFKNTKKPGKKPGFSPQNTIYCGVFLQ